MTNPNDPAFPKQITSAPFWPGLTKREYFAAMAMSGVACWDALLHQNHPSKAGNNLAIACVQFADALIEELSKEVKPE